MQVVRRFGTGNACDDRVELTWSSECSAAAAQSDLANVALILFNRRYNVLSRMRIDVVSQMEKILRDLAANRNLLDRLPE